MDLAPDDQVECVPFAAKIPARVCAARHLAREPSGGGRGSPAVEFAVCARCATGAARTAELVRLGYRIPAFKRFSVVRENAQRAARSRAWREGRIGRLPTMDEAPAEDGGEAE